MARTSTRERPDREEVLWPVQKACPACGHPMRLRYAREFIKGRQVSTGKNEMNRLYVVESMADRFIQAVVEKVERLRALAPVSDLQMSAER